MGLFTSLLVKDRETMLSDQQRTRLCHRPAVTWPGWLGTGSSTLWHTEVPSWEWWMAWNPLPFCPPHRVPRLGLRLLRYGATLASWTKRFSLGFSTWTWSFNSGRQDWPCSSEVHQLLCVPDTCVPEGLGISMLTTTCPSVLLVGQFFLLPTTGPCGSERLVSWLNRWVKWH